MELIKLDKNSNYQDYLSVAILHKSTLKKTLASTLTNKNLANLYSYLVQKNFFEILTIKEENKLVGVVSIRFKYKRFNIKNLMYLVKFSIFGIINHPIIWITEIYFKIGLYKNVSSRINIVTLFVLEKYQSKNYGSILLNNVINEYESEISVDTRTKNTSAINFYKKNNFKLVNQNFKNTVLLY